MLKEKTVNEFKTKTKAKTIEQRYKRISTDPAHSYFKFLDLNSNGKFLLVGIAKKLCIDLGFNFESIKAEMLQNDGENIIDVFDNYFNGYVSDNSFKHPREF